MYLGVGSIRRMIPYLVFCQNGLYDNVDISYDSTTHSRAVETGLYYMGKGTTKFSVERCLICIEKCTIMCKKLSI